LAILPKCKNYDTFQDVRFHIMAVDDILCVDTFLGNLISFAPTKDDDLKVMQKYLDGPSENCEELDIPEQFTVEVKIKFKQKKRET
jgi:hypothetical protein